MFDAKGIELKGVEPEDTMADATGAGRGYGVAGGVASAIEACIREYYPDVEVNIEHAESLAAVSYTHLVHSATSQAHPQNPAHLETPSPPSAPQASSQNRTYPDTQPP